MLEGSEFRGGSNVDTKLDKVPVWSRGTWQQSIENVHHCAGKDISVWLCSGLEYIEEGCNEAGTAASFYCKLCDCHFTDPHAKLMHTKGRRHRQNYKVCSALFTYFYL